jgi:hypothetical protein
MQRISVPQVLARIAPYLSAGAAELDGTQ